MKKGKYQGLIRLGLITALALAIAMGMMARQTQLSGNEPKEAETTQAPSASAAGAGERVSKTCEIIQTMGFSRCGHSVTRRIQAPADTVGMDFGEAQRRFQDWRLESFSGDRIMMSREIPLFCPMHWVLSVNEAGSVVLTRNVYGDGMAVERDYGLPLNGLDQTDQEKLMPGLGFDSAEEAEAWLSAH